MARNFRELEAKMSPERIARAKRKADKILAGLLLAEMRKASSLSQAELARALGIRQPTLSRLESQSDMQLSTLARIVEALGGYLEIVAHLPKGEFRVSQFASAKAA